MTDRERLIELLLQSDPIKERDLDDEWFDGETEDISDHLLANGVIVPKREKDEHKIQIGDVLYEGSYSYGKVFEWKILDIWLENYISGNKTIVKCSNGTWTKEFFVADVLQFHKTKEEAEAELEKRGKENEC